MTAVTVSPARAKRRAARQSLPWGSPVVYFVALVVIALMLAPIAYIIIGGFRTNAQITVDPSGLPNPWNFSNYLTVLTGGTFWQQALNSVIAALGTTIGTVVLGLMASYVLARYTFRGRGMLYALFAASATRLLASPRARRRFHFAGGSLLSAAGVWALLARRVA